MSLLFDPGPHPNGGAGGGARKRAALGCSKRAGSGSSATLASLYSHTYLPTAAARSTTYGPF